MRTTLRNTLLLLALLLCLPGRAALCINEIMQSNVDCLMDDRHDYPDSWVELYNPSSQPVSLSGYSLALSAGGAEDYQLPSNVSVEGHSHIVIFCDKENTGMHTSFRLEPGKGGEVHLRKRGVEVDAVVNIPKQPAPNLAYGRVSENANQWGWQHTPTPGRPNAGLAQGILLPPVFSQSGFVSNSSFSTRVSLCLPADAPASAIIRYTLDGSEPTLTNGYTYATPLMFSSTTVVRARTFSEGYASAPSATQSYIFLGRKVTLPVVSIVTNPEHFYSSQEGIYTQQNCHNNWRRPINLEYFTTVGNPAVINQLCETRIQGGASRGSELKSLALYANKRFGEKRFNYEFFPDQKPGLTDYKSLLLRNAGNDFDYLYMRDAIIQRAMASRVDLDWQAWRPVIVFINGIYKGIENIRERSNDDNIFTNYDHLEDITMLENDGDMKAGDWSTWNTFRTFFSQRGHTMAEYQEQMDCTEYINLMIMNLFFNNQDFPANNIVFWRPNQDTPELPARWRVVAKDTDFGLGLYDNPATYQTFAWFYTPGSDPDHDWGNNPQATCLFRYAMEDPDFKQEFLFRTALYVGDFLNFDSIWPMWNTMYSTIRTEYPIHRELYNRWWPNYSEELSKAKQWLQQRPVPFFEDLCRQYGLSEMTQLSINGELLPEHVNQLEVNVGGVPLRKASWTGRFFTNCDIALSAQPAEGSQLQLEGWEVTYVTPSGIASFQTDDDSVLISIPEDVSRAHVNIKVRATTGWEDTEPITAPRKVMLPSGKIIIYRDGVGYDLLGGVCK